LDYGQTHGFNFSGIGEPLLNRDLARFVSYVAPHTTTYLTTNGSLLSESKIDALLQAGLHHITLSFDGADAESYERIMVNLDFSQTLGAIQRLVTTANDQLAIWANVAVSKLTRDQLPQITEILRDLGIKNVMYSLCHSRAGSLIDEAICEPQPPPPTSRCDIFVDNTFVAWDGSVLACCQDVAGAAILGDLTTMPMESLANVRRQILERGVDFPMCPDCDDIYRLYHDEPPPGASLSEWIYQLYENEDSRTAALTNALRLTETELEDVRSQLAVLESENAHLRQTVAGYERGRFVRLMRWLHFQRERLRS
jgi:hypothetical protein